MVQSCSDSIDDNDIINWWLYGYQCHDYEGKDQHSKATMLVMEVQPYKEEQGKEMLV